MFGAILGALKGIGSGISSGISSGIHGLGSGVQSLGGMLGKGLKDETGHFDWSKVSKAAETFGHGMGPQSQIGQGLERAGHAGTETLRARALDRVASKMETLKKATQSRPVSTVTAEEAGIGGELTPRTPPTPPPPPSPKVALIVPKADPGISPPASMFTSQPAPSPSQIQSAPSSSLEQQLNSALGTGQLMQPQQKVYAPAPELVDPMAFPEQQAMIPLDLPDVEFDPETGYVRKGGRPLAY